jgi:hypothetical protein
MAVRDDRRIPNAQRNKGTTMKQREALEIARPKRDAKSEAIFWLNEIEKYQGGANGPTIKVRAAIEAKLKELNHG